MHAGDRFLIFHACDISTGSSKEMTLSCIMKLYSRKARSIMLDNFLNDVGEPYVYFQQSSLAQVYSMMDFRLDNERKSAKGISSLAVV